MRFAYLPYDPPNGQSNVFIFKTKCYFKRRCDKRSVIALTVYVVVISAAINQSAPEKRAASDLPLSTVRFKLLFYVNYEIKDI